MPVVAFETGLYNGLKSISGLITELGGTIIYNKRSPQPAPAKYCIFRYQGGGDVNDTPTRERNLVYSIFGVAGTQELAAAIDSQVDGGLHQVGTALTVSGWKVLWIAREGDVNFTEFDSGGVAHEHVGGLYRIIIDEDN